MYPLVYGDDVDGIVDDGILEYDSSGKDVSNPLWMLSPLLS